MQMIPKKTLTVEPHWQKELANCFTTIESLAEYLQLPALSTQNIEQHSKARRLFPMRVPRPFADLMEIGNWDDPLLKQVLPSSSEFITAKGFVDDPLEEQSNQQTGLIHKYKSRVLLILKGACAVNCRYCFRRHFPYKDNHLRKSDIDNIFHYIQKDTSLNEVILSGGDPLMANNKALQNIVEQLHTLDHIKRLRIHTRLPVVIPQRIDDGFLALLQHIQDRNKQLKVILVFHINHANEIGQALRQKCELLKAHGVLLLNQSVLLKNINDNEDTLCELSENLIDAGILPYYLHMFDPVKGASHFDVSRHKATTLIAEMIKRLPGFLVPKLVKEIPGQPGKTPIDLGLEP
ncbi:EF-P beta-lysylation protein EpmB [Glaciecola petra]|uniref:L-lysine 2,3-aminomutase n=1 Tax=Glaciecola petra TaxID=3075602 RepID=A0ABU2ZL74_9ALTE|nr:EF-P beta-lysylation protein EpmB [Aestuariibacter sp. P117]MDT0593371.1 EF-P beta-lysylation protein EpmB [Aestuariibacter sp. P117]